MNGWCVNLILPQTFTYIGRSKENTKNFISFIIAFCGICILLGGIYFMFKTPLTMKNEDEDVPLLKENKSSL